VHDARQPYRIIFTVARNVVLFLDQHRQQFLSRHPRNQIGLVARIHPTLSNIADDCAIIAPCPRGVALICQSDRELVEKFTLARAARQIVGMRPPSPHIAAVDDDVVIGRMRSTRSDGCFTTSMIRSLMMLKLECRSRPCASMTISCATSTEVPPPTIGSGNTRGCRNSKIWR